MRTACGHELSVPDSVPESVPESVPAQVRLLLVEDDRETAEMLAELFREQGFEVDLAFDGHRALHLGMSRRHDMMVIDRGLPTIDGVELVTRFRRIGVSARILVLTAFGDVTDRIDGLEAGADDYLPKPFDVGELVARVRALLRRHLDRSEVLRLGNGELNLPRREVVFPAGRTVVLSGREFELLRLLAGAPRSVFARSDLRTRVFTDTSAESLVDTYVHYLRRKLGRGVIRTVRGLGYQIGSI